MKKVIAPIAVVLLTLILVVIVLVATDRGSLSCAGSDTTRTTETTIPSTTSTAGTTSSTDATTTTTTEPPTTTTMPATTTTTARSTTTTTLSALGKYRAEVRAWKNKHSEDLEAGYEAMIGVKDLNNPTSQEIRAAKDLDAAMTAMLADLAAIQPPPFLSGAHNGFLTSLTKMAAGVHDLAVALENGQALRGYAAMAAIGLAWQEGAPHRAMLEAALGFSVSGA